MSRPRLSVCMIVRDEQTMLPGMLESVANLADEICVVDTGSTDGSKDLLAAAGATVVDRPWDDDFAAARNASLAMATGDWILVLDADERVTPELAGGIRSLLDQTEIGAATVVQRDDLPDGLRRETRLLRLFRNDPSIRYKHRIHEDATAAIEKVLSRNGRRCVDLDGVLQHLGYQRTLAADRRKKERDLALLRRCVDENDGDWYSRHKMLELARFWHDGDLWRDLARETHDAVESAPRDALATESFAGEMLVNVARGTDLQDEAMIEFLSGWSQHVPPSLELQMMLGLAAEILGYAEEAATAYGQALELAETRRLAASTTRPLMGLSRLKVLAGELDAARDLAWRAIAGSPADPEALLAVVSYAWDLGLLAGERVRYLSEHDNLAAWSQASGEHALLRGDWQTAVDELDVAAGTPPAGAAGELLAQAKLGACEVNEARELAASLFDELPTAALGVLVCDLVLGNDLALDVELTQEEADASLRRWLDVLWRSRDTVAMTGFLDRAGLINEYFPWLSSYLETLTRRLSAQ